jgi:hypothetical protein
MGDVVRCKGVAALGNAKKNDVVEDRADCLFAGYREAVRITQSR